VRNVKIFIIPYVSGKKFLPGRGQGRSKGGKKPVKQSQRKDKEKKLQIFSPKLLISALK
jgi:hypothetical protein